MELVIKSFHELNNLELYEILELRAEVFVVEQDCAYQDVDGKDVIALHVLGRSESKLIAYSRIFKPGDYYEEASMGRIVVKAGSRTGGLGREMVRASEKAINECFHTRKIKMSAQKYLQSFYTDLGYKTTGDEYLEDGIPHILMVKN